jgi:hypothetical protein
MKVLSPKELRSIRIVAEKAVVLFTRNKLQGLRRPAIYGTMCHGAVDFMLRSSGNGSIWFNSTAPWLDHNCVSSSPSAVPGVVVTSRFDATNLIEWVAEELKETLIRFKIIRGIRVAKHDNLIEMIQRRVIRTYGPFSSEDGEGFLGVIFKGL